MGLLGFLISVLGLLSITKDTLDLAVSYVIPTPTPAPLICTVVDPLGPDNRPGIALRQSPMTFGGQVITSLPHGTEIEILDMVPGDMTNFYQISSYYYDDGPIVITGVHPGSPAEDAGLQVGDIVLKIGDESTQRIDVLRNYVLEHAGENITLILQRNLETISVNIIPRISPPEGQGAIGITWQGGIEQGSGGYFPVMAASCPSDGPESPESLVSEGIRLAEIGEIESAKDIFKQAQLLDETFVISADAWGYLCWLGGIWGQASEVMQACDQAIVLDPQNGPFHGSRGLALALTGDNEGAIEEFAFASEWWEINSPEAPWAEREKEWIVELEAGRNPFNEEILEALRNER